MANPQSNVALSGQRLYDVLHNQLNIPWKHSVTIIRSAKALAHPVEYLKRRSYARELLRKPTPYVHSVPHADGYRIFKPDDLPGAREAAAACARIFDQLQADAGPDGSLGRNRKRHFQAIFSGTDFLPYPEVTRFAVSRPVLEAAVGYFGTVPILSTICMFWSAKNDTRISSQQFHVDGEDVTQLKLFLNVWDVGDENGPLTFFPAAPTSSILKAASRQKRLNAGNEAFDDELVFSGSQGCEPVRVTGPAGSGVFLDTSRCIHFGSRGNTQERLILMLKYVPFNSARESSNTIESTDWIATDGDDDLQRLVLGAQ